MVKYLYCSISRKWYVDILNAYTLFTVHCSLIFSICWYGWAKKLPSLLIFYLQSIFLYIHSLIVIVWNHLFDENNITYHSEWLPHSYNTYTLNSSDSQMHMNPNAKYDIQVTNILLRYINQLRWTYDRRWLHMLEFICELWI